MKERYTPPNEVNKNRTKAGEPTLYTEQKQWLI